MNIWVQVFVDMFSFLLARRQSVETLSCFVGIHLTFKDVADLFAKQLYHLTFPQAVYEEVSSFSTSLPTACFLFWFVYSSRSGRCVILPHYGFKIACPLMTSDDGHLFWWLFDIHIISLKCLYKSLFIFKNWAVYVSTNVLYKCLKYFLCKSFIRLIFWKYFPPVCGLSFHFLSGIFLESESFKFWCSIYSFFLLLMLLESYLRIISCHMIFSYVFLKGL